MANIKNTEVVNNITDYKTSSGATVGGLNSTRSSTSNFNYGDYSVANVAMVMNTVNSLAKHIYSNFIPNDRIIPDTYKISEDADDSNIIFYKKNSDGSDVEVTEAGKDFLNYLITGKVLKDNIEFHKPKINGTYDYDKDTSFLLDTDPGDGNYAGRNNTIYCWQNGASSASWLGVTVNPNYTDTSITSSGISIKIDNQLQYKDSKNATSFENANENGKSIELFDSSFNKYNFSFKNTGLLNKIENKGETNKASLNSITQEDDIELKVYIPTSDTTNSVSKATLTFSKFGILKSITTTETTDYKLIDASSGKSAATTISAMTDISSGSNTSTDDEGKILKTTLSFDSDGVLISVVNDETAQTYKVITTEEQKIVGRMDFDSGIGLPSNTEGAVTLS